MYLKETEKKKIIGYTGNYEYFKEVSKMEKENNVVEKKPEKKERQKENNKPLKLSFKEQKEWDEIDEIIAKLENDILDIETKMAEASSDYTKLQELFKEKEIIENKLEEKMERWIYLSELVEKIEEQKRD